MYSGGQSKIMSYTYPQHATTPLVAQVYRLLVSRSQNHSSPKYSGGKEKELGSPMKTSTSELLEAHNTNGSTVPINQNIPAGGKQITSISIITNHRIRDKQSLD